MAELQDMSAGEQAQAVRRRQLSPVELTRHYLDRVERLDTRVGAFVTVTTDRAVEQARAAELLLAAGRDELPPLHGVPIAVKDLTQVAGVRCTSGAAVYADAVAPVDDHVVTLLRAAGTVLLGKTNTPEFGLPCYTEPDVAPPARTPWDLTRTAGGSSGGAAAAVAAGLVPFAHGSDGGGSIRIPASCCGIVGLKTSRGRVSNGPILGDLNGLGGHGCLARSVGDAALLLDAMAVPMPGDPHWAPPLPPGEAFADYATRDCTRLRIGRYRVPVIADAVVHPDCVAAYERASTLLDGLGHELIEVEPPFGPELVPAFETVWAVSAATAPVPAGQEDRLRPLTRWLRARGRDMPAPVYVAALAAMQSAARAAVTATWHLDAVLTPALASPPPPVGAMRDDADPAGDFAAQKRFTPFTAPYNVTGQPALTLPVQRNADGLPISVQLVGRPAGEGGLLTLAAQLEAACGQLPQPPLWRD
ncbi:amidase [soil metagenome]